MTKPVGMLARELGRLTFSGGPTASAVRHALAQMNDCDRALFMAGVTDALNARLSSAANDDERRAVTQGAFLRGGGTREALRELFADDEQFAFFELLRSLAPTSSIH